MVSWWCPASSETILGAETLANLTVSLFYWEHKEVASLRKTQGLCSALAGRDTRLTSLIAPLQRTLPMSTERLPCIVCGSQQSIESARVRCNVREFRDQSFDMWRCGECGTLHSQESIELEKYYQNYPVKRHQLDLATKLLYQRQIRNYERQGMRKGYHILDFGCGAGLRLDFLKKQGYGTVFGYDAFVEKYSDPNTLNRTYDVVISQDVVEHFDDPREFFKITSGCVKPGGLLIVGTPNADEIDLSDIEEFLLELHQPYHRHILTESTLKEMGTEFGLDCFATDNRSYLDTLFPVVNTRFIKRYLQESGNYHDVLFDPPKIGLVLSRPALWFPMIAGYLYRSPGLVTMYYKKTEN